MNKKQTIRINESQLRRIVSESVKRVLNEAKVSRNPKKANLSQLKIEIPIVKQNIKRVKRELLDSVGDRNLMVKILSNGKVVFYIDTNKTDSIEEALHNIENAGFVVNKHFQMSNLYVYEIDAECNNLTKVASSYMRQLNILKAREEHLLLTKMSASERDDYQ